MVIEICSSDDDAGGERRSETGEKGLSEKENKTGKKGLLGKGKRIGKKGPLEKEKKTRKKRVKDVGDLDCVVLDCNPSDSVDLSKKLSTHDFDQDVSVIAERGQVACRDYPHSRHLCVKFPFTGSLHESYCEQCYCYVCDSKAPCKYWKGSEPEHCHASDRETKWRSLRREAGGNVQVSGAVRKTGTITRFDDEMGYGFVTPDHFSYGESQDLLFLVSSVMLDGSSSRRISRGDKVEYEISPINGAAEAVKFIRPAIFSQR